MTRDGTSKVNSVYLNGVFAGSFNGTTDIAYDGTQHLYLGRWGGGGRHWNGMIYELEIYNRALSQEEIQAIYNAGSAGKCRPCSTPPSSIVSWWKAEDNGEDSIGTNNGTLINGVTFATGISGKSFGFNGLNQYISINDSNSLKPSKITIEGWINISSVPSGPDDYLVIFDHQSANPWYGYVLHIHPSGKLEAVIYTNGFKSLLSNTVFNANRWYHIAAVYDGEYLRLFVDGIEETNTPLTGNINYSVTVDPTIGKRSIVNAYYFRGKIDELTIYNRGLTAKEILSIYNSRSPGKCLNFLLQVNKTGNAGGIISSNPSGINCGTICSYDFKVYSNVILNAQAENNSFFSGWGGYCSSCGTSTQCQIYLDSNKSCSASFSLKAPSEASGRNNPLYAEKGSGTSVNVSFFPSNCATDHSIYWGQSPILGNLNWTNGFCGFGNSGSVNFDPGNPPSGSFYYFVIVGNNGEKEGSYGKDSSGLERPEATGITSCDWPLGTENACQ